jgi:hypothetical protein
MRRTDISDDSGMVRAQASAAIAAFTMFVAQYRGRPMKGKRRAFRICTNHRNPAQRSIGAWNPATFQHWSFLRGANLTNKGGLRK